MAIVQNDPRDPGEVAFHTVRHCDSDVSWFDVELLSHRMEGSTHAQVGKELGKGEELSAGTAGCRLGRIEGGGHGGWTQMTGQVGLDTGWDQEAGCCKPEARWNLRASPYLGRSEFQKDAPERLKLNGWLAKEVLAKSNKLLAQRNWFARAL